MSTLQALLFLALFMTAGLMAFNIVLLLGNQLYLAVRNRLKPGARLP